MNETTKAALLTLLEDEDPTVYQAVRTKILSLGPGVRSWLNPHLLSENAIIRRRTQEIIDRIERLSADNRFLAFCLCHGEDLDVEQGMWLLARTRYPHVNPEAYGALLDSYAGDLKERIDFGGSTEQILATINQYLFAELGFRGNEQEYYDPDNSYLNRVIDRRQGNPISLCLIYWFVARRLRLPVAGIGMPGHFLCRFQSTTDEIFIDGFNQGKLLTKADCVKYLIQTSHGFQEGFLAPSSPLRTLLRVCTNLRQIYLQSKLTEESDRFQRYIVALEK